MKIVYTRIPSESRQAVEAEFERHREKLEKLLKHYDPDLVELQGTIETIARKKEFELSLNLVIPTGPLHATGVGSDIPTSTKAAFAEIEAQIKKHQQKLRKDYVWKRKRGRGVPKLGEVATD
ncbi:MAG TPA: HPF/RaiA family ribosome-associated protein [Candidatus Acidoferrales bacterium]|jgi:ribosome-associated translation inhibitor RaiA|nr:HPF/RaiA family ribosome-associated protein [Candidatus Acidoferrales bacterium]